MSEQNQLIDAQGLTDLPKISKRSVSEANENLKEQIGELLLYLQSPLTEDEQKRCWRMFELKLREYLAIKHPHR
jgi:hypothetical protein